MDYSYFLNPDNLVRDDNNKEYTGDSSSFLDKLLNFVQNLKDEYLNVRNPNNNPDNPNFNTNGTNNNITNNDISVNSSSHVSSGSSIDPNIGDVGSDMVVNGYSSRDIVNPTEFKSTDEDNPISSADSSSKSYEIEKISASKEISNNNSLIVIILVIIIIFALLVYGYKKK